MKATAISVECIVNAPMEKVWNYWTAPEHIMQWCNASDDWHAPHAENDLKTGGNFVTTMAAKDGSFSFDFGGTYTQIEEHALIAYNLGDERKVQITFDTTAEGVHIVETFDPETQNPVDMQRAGWQSILNNFKKYTESH